MTSAAVPKDNEQITIQAVKPSLGATNVGSSPRPLGGTGALFQTSSGPVSFSVDQHSKTGTENFTVTYKIKNTSGTVVATKSLSGNKGGGFPTGSIYFGVIGAGYYTVEASTSGPLADITVQVYS